MRSFHGPHAFLKPVEQRQVVCCATKESLAKMNMRLNKAGKNDATPDVDDDVSCLAGLAYSRYPTVSYKQIATDDGVLVIHRQ